MKRVATLVSVVLVLCLAFALPTLANEGAKKKTHDVTVEFVSADAKAKTITFKDEKGETQTAAVLDPAVKSLDTLKAGDKITLTCQDTEYGDHQGVSMIKVAMAKKEK